VPTNDNTGTICFDSAGNVFFCGQARIYKMATNGQISTYAGSGNFGSADGNGIFTSFFFPTTLAVDSSNNIYVWDSNNQLIRKININRDVTTIAGHYAQGLDIDGIGTGAAFSTVHSMCFDTNGNLILGCGSSVRKMTPSLQVTTLAGSFTQMGYTNGPGNLARFRNAFGVCVSGGVIYVSDAGDHRIRSITLNPSSPNAPGADLQLGMYPGLNITGIVGRTYQIQSSPDMNAWSNRATLYLTASPFFWLDQSGSTNRQYYRAVLLP
jgi:hypothetical protein